MPPVTGFRECWRELGAPLKHPCGIPVTPAQWVRGTGSTGVSLTHLLRVPVTPVRGFGCCWGGTGLAPVRLPGVPVAPLGVFEGTGSTGVPLTHPFTVPVTPVGGSGGSWGAWGAPLSLNLGVPPAATPLPCHPNVDRKTLDGETGSLGPLRWGLDAKRFGVLKMRVWALKMWL